MTPDDLAINLELAFLDAQERFGASAVNEPLLTRKVAATDLYYKLRQRRPDLLPAIGEGGQITAAAAKVIDTLDQMYGTEGFLLQSLQGGREPNQALDAEKKVAADTLLGQAGFGPGVFESRARELVGSLTDADLDLNKDGKVTDEERAEAMKKAMAQARKEMGIVDPLSDDEALMLSRYMEALSDDGKATREELGEDYDAARAAYEKGRRVENLPRGASAYYDDSYLDLLGRRQTLRSQAERATSLDGTPIERAAARAEGLPEIDADAYAAAAAISPLAAESMPWAMKRFTDAGGAISPQSMVENKADAIINASPTKRPNFNDFTQQINKLYPDDALKRREAYAYYGAYFNAVDTRGTTLSDAKLRGDVNKVAREMERDLPKPPRNPRQPPLVDGYAAYGGVPPVDEMDFYTEMPEIPREIIEDLDPEQMDPYLPFPQTVRPADEGAAYGDELNFGDGALPPTRLTDEEVEAEIERRLFLEEQDADALLTPEQLRARDLQRRREAAGR